MFIFKNKTTGSSQRNQGQPDHSAAALLGES